MSRNPRGFEQRLAEGTILGAEGYVFELERRGHIKAGPYVPEVILDEPDAVVRLHREFLNAGAEVMVALTYYAHRDKLRDVGREGDLEEMNRTAVRMANQVAAEGDAIVAGNICNTWAYDQHDPKTSGLVVRRQYEEQLGWAVEEGIDFVIAETNDYLGEALIAVEVCKAMKLPIVVTLAAVDRNKTEDGVGYVEACKRLADAGADVVGINCSRGPDTILPLTREIRAAVTCGVAAQPVPYRTTEELPSFQLFKDAAGNPAYPIAMEQHLLNRFEMADFARDAAEIGVNYIGICCGGAPHHVRAMAEALGRTAPNSKYSPAMELHPVLGRGEEYAGWDA